MLIKTTIKEKIHRMWFKFRQVRGHSNDAIKETEITNKTDTLCPKETPTL